MEGLDKIDLKILRALQEDASHSAAEIADSVGLSQSPCYRRIQRLKEEGYITRIVAMLDRRKLNLLTQLFVQVKVIRNDQQSLQEFTEYIRSFPEVLECHVILGAYDFLLRVVVRDMEGLREILFRQALHRAQHPRGEFLRGGLGSEVDDLAAAEDRVTRMSSAASSVQYAYIMRKARAGDAFPRSSCPAAGVGFSSNERYRSTVPSQRPARAH